MIEQRSIIYRTDSYKYSHNPSYKPSVTNVSSYLESRGGRYSETAFTMLQYYLKKYFTKPVTLADIDIVEEFCAQHFGRNDVFNRKGWEGIVNKHGGYLPLKIKAVPEGTIVPVSNILMNIKVTNDDYRWLTNHVETLLMKLWYPITIATQSREIRKTLLGVLEKTGTPELIDFMCHDFGYRGVTCEEQAEIGGAAHLLSFSGTDTTAAIWLLKDYYGAGMPGFSIPATEHSNMTSFGRNHEIEACENFLDAYKTGTIGCVSDTYNIYECCEHIWGGALRDKVLYREGKLVVRPDSGDYFEVVPKVLDILWNKFGGQENRKGYKVLNSHIGVIQGDGMNPNSIRDLHYHINRLGWSSDNLTVGSGGGLLMKDIDRDTQKFAIKASAVKDNNEWVGIFKSPVTDPGKKSKVGELKLIKDYQGQFKTVPESEYGEDQLVTYFENGEIKVNYTFDEIKQRMR